ncbi:MAG: hypothetical protein CL927_02100 [Deltaproteobacteria bacterium]|nr:hypothetical protein [Deltaproteobacteria bacterium]
MSRWVPLLALGLVLGCRTDPKPDPMDTGRSMTGAHGPIAANIAGPMGTAVPYATAEERATFERGKKVALHRFSYDEGLGPAFNVSFCASCHEKPVTGGSGGLYRNFFLTGIVDEYGVFFPAESAGASGGVVRLYHRPDMGEPVHPELDPRTNVIAQRNPIPFFGVGLIAELSNEEILKHADPDDEDGDGISGRANYDRGFVGRFGRKSQTVSIEGFIRGPLKNHLGITTDPLTDAQKADLPVDSSAASTMDGATGSLFHGVLPYGQAAADDGPITDDDGAPDPELSGTDLFDLVSMTMLMAAPDVRTELTPTELDGRNLFDGAGCADCHTPRLTGPRGPLPVYSDLLLHDMGPELADGLVQGEASGDEFRTQPLWGIAAVGPYLHDGRATTIDEAIVMHGGEAQASADHYIGLSRTEQDQLIAFLLTLGGAEQATGGLLLPNQPVPAVGEYGGPIRALSTTEMAAFQNGRDAFDFEFGLSDGIGAPRYNGDSCRACHFEPVIGGAGPRGVNVVRHGTTNSAGTFVNPDIGTILHRVNSRTETLNPPEEDTDIFVLHSTPSLLGVGLIEGIPEAAITANADPNDTNGDGISGRISYIHDGRVGRFGWKAQIPSLREFVRDAVAAEMGMTMAPEEGQTFGILEDDDNVPDPEFRMEDAQALLTFMSLLGPPPRQTGGDPASIASGERVFREVGCADCHIPALEGAGRPVALFSDLLLHEITAPGTPGIAEASASMNELRTPPLWGLATSGPWLHDGSADTIDEAIDKHAGEATRSAEAYQALSGSDAADLILFLESL